MPHDLRLDNLIVRWSKALATRLNPAGPAASEHAPELAQFHERLDQLRSLAETTSDPLRSSAYDSLWRTMGEELGFIAADVDRGRLAADDLPAAFEQWSELGLSYIRTRGDHSEADKILAVHEGISDTPVGVAGSASDRLGAEPIKAHLQQLRADAVAAGDNIRADELESTVSMIEATIQDFARQAAQDELPVSDSESRRSAERAKLHHTIHEYVFQLDIDVPDGMLDELPAARTPHWLADDQEIGHEASGDDSAALRQLTHDSDYETVHVIADNATERLTEADDRASARFGGSDRHRILIEDLGADDSDEATAAADKEATAVDDSDSQQRLEQLGDRQPVDAVGEAEPGRDAARGGAHQGDDTSDDEVSAAIGTVACNVAISRASATAGRTAQTFNEAADNDRAEQMDAWHDDDTAVQRQVEDLASKAGTTTVDGNADW